MRNAWLVGLILLLSATWALAQQTQSNSQTTSGSKETTIEGCLTGSGGDYTLSDQSGKIYQIEGDAAKLSKHVGHEVRLTGTETSAASASGAAAATGTAESKAKFNVSKVEHVSTSCTAPKK